LWEGIADKYKRCGYRFVPLATSTTPNLTILVGVEILFLRQGEPGTLMKSGDIDGRLKTLFDALRMPSSQGELGGYDTPSDGEDPFFVLMEDDKLLSHVSVETDTLLQPTPTANAEIKPNDARLVITVSVRPHRVHLDFTNLL
jgi:hypothetical protein